MIKKQIIVEKDKKMVDFIQDFGFSFADVNKMMRNKDIKVNGVAQKQNIMLYEGDKVVFFYSSDMLEKKYKKVFENDDAIIIFKNAGIEVEGEKGLEKVLGAIAVHRLDRNTEGLMVFAKNNIAKERLLKAFKNNLVHKFYVCEVVGNFSTAKKTFKAYLLKDGEKSQVKIFQNAVKGAVQIETSVKTIKSGSQSSLLEVELLTGKTHQIRAHLAFLGHPIIGDGKYGKNETNKKFKENKQKLCCFLIKFDFVGIDGLDNKSFEMKPRWMTL